MIPSVRLSSIPLVSYITSSCTLPSSVSSSFTALRSTKINKYNFKHKRFVETTNRSSSALYRTFSTTPYYYGSQCSNPLTIHSPTTHLASPTVLSSSSTSSWNTTILYLTLSVLLGAAFSFDHTTFSSSSAGPNPPTPENNDGTNDITPSSSLTAEEFTYQLKSMLDLFRRIYGISDINYPSSFVPSSSSSTTGISSSSSSSAAIRRPLVRLFRRPLVSSNDEIDSDTSASLGYEIVMDIQFIPTPLALPDEDSNNDRSTTPNSNDSKANNSSSSVSSVSSLLTSIQVSNGKRYTNQTITQSTVIAIHLLHDIYRTHHHQNFGMVNPSTGQVISSLPIILSSALTPPASMNPSDISTFIFRIRPDLIVTVRPTNEGNSTEICWKPIPVAFSPPSTTTARNTDSQSDTSFSSNKLKSSAYTPVGLTTQDVQAIAYLFGTGARDWNVSRQSLTTSYSVKQVPFVITSQTSLIDRERILRQREKDAFALYSLIQSVTTIASTEYTRKIGQQTVIDTPPSPSLVPPVRNTKRLPNSRSSFVNDPAGNDIDSFEDSSDTPFPVGASSRSLASLFGDKTNSIDPKTQPLKLLRSFGIKYYNRKNNSNLDWNDLAGYSTIQKEIEDSVLFPMQHPELYTEIVQQTRMKPESNLHGTYLFSGPPGTGKTTTARILAALTDRPLVVLNFETIGSPYFSASETNLSKVLDAVAAIPNAILFIDEAESMFPSRFGGYGGRSTTADISNKLVAQMLTFIEGMEGSAATNVIFASNRPETLDTALLSRCAATVTFDLPTASQRTEIWKRYAKHLTVSSSPSAELAGLVDDTEGFSARDIKKICEIAERRHIAALQRQGITQTTAITPPTVKDYEVAIDERWTNVLLMNKSNKYSMGSSGSRSKGEQIGGGGGSRRQRTNPPPLYRSDRLPPYGQSSSSSSSSAVPTTNNVYYSPSPAHQYYYDLTTGMITDPTNIVVESADTMDTSGSSNRTPPSSNENATVTRISKGKKEVIPDLYKYERSTEGISV